MPVHPPLSTPVNATVTSSGTATAILCGIYSLCKAGVKLKIVKLSQYVTFDYYYHCQTYTTLSRQKDFTHILIIKIIANYCADTPATCT